MKRLPLLLVFVATVIPFLGALGADFVNWDDHLVIVGNASFRGFRGEHLAWMFGAFHMGHYHPLTWLSFAVDHAMFGLRPFGYHLANLLWHALAAVACYALFRELLRHLVGADTTDAARDRWLCAMGALLFSIHPLRVESVAWVTERRDVISGVFWIVTVWCYLRAHRVDTRAPRRDLALAHGAFVLSLLGKAWGITLPVVLLLLDLLLLQRRARGASWSRLCLEKSGFVGIALVFATLAIAAQAHWGAQVALDRHPLLARSFQACYALALYVGKTLLPVGLSPLYPLEAALDWSQPRFLLSAAAVLGVAVALARARRRMPGFVLAVSVFVVVVAPALGFAQSGPQIAADRYTYLACLPFPALVVGWLARRPHATPYIAGLAVVLALFGGLTVRQTAIWHDSLRLWEHTLTLAPDSYHAHFHYGGALLTAGHRDRALIEFRRTVTLQPRHHDAWYLIGIEEYRRAKYSAAQDAHLRAHRLAPGDRDNMHGLARATLALDRPGECVRWCERTQEVDPNWPHSWPLLGEALLRLGQRRQARSALDRALELDPGNQEVRQRLAELR